jgi:hypothetical protein
VLIPSLIPTAEMTPVAARCDYIITYNERDFSGVETFGIRVLDLRAFLQERGELT